MKAQDLIYLAIGRVAVSWAEIEHTLDYCLALIYANCRGNLVQDDFPIAIAKKLQLLRRALKTDKRLLPLVEDGQPIITSILRFKQYRVKVLHGSVAGYTTSTVTFSVRTLARRKSASRKLPVYSRTVVRVDKIEKYGEEMEAFCYDFGYFSSRLWRAFHVSTRSG